MRYSLFCLLSLSMAAAPVSLAAQMAGGGEPRAAADSYSEYYLGEAADGAAIFNGREQAPMLNNVQSLYLRQKGFWGADEMNKNMIPRPQSNAESYTEGTILYAGTRYSGVPMRLDLRADELVVLTPDGAHNIVLDADRVGWAEFHGYRVVSVPRGSGRRALDAGYYEELHRSEGVRVFRKERFAFERIGGVFIEHVVRYYVMQDGAAHRVTNRKSLLNLFPQYKRELRDFIKNSGLDLRRDMERGVVSVVREYEKLNNGQGL